MALETAPPTLPDKLIVEEILTRLPLKFVIISRCTCKVWNSLLSEPGFMQSQLNRSISQNPKDDYLICGTRKYSDTSHTIRFPDGISIISCSNFSKICIDNFPYHTDSIHNNYQLDDIQLIGSINGLVCMVRYFRLQKMLHSYHFIIWNPALNLCKNIQLPKDGTSKQKRVDYYKLFGFGFDSVTNNYKILVQSTKPAQAFVYSCETDSWINIVGTKFCKYHVGLMCWAPSVIVKGICYWNCFDTVEVLKFEAKNNKFSYLDVQRVGEYYQLVNLNDCLARIEYAQVGQGIMDVYVFNEECNLWSKFYTINSGINDDSLNDVNLILSCFKSGGMIVFDSKNTYYSFCDLKSNERKNLACLCDGQYYRYFCRGFSFTPSLVALEGMESERKSLCPQGR